MFLLSFRINRFQGLKRSQSAKRCVGGLTVARSSACIGLFTLNDFFLHAKLTEKLLNYYWLLMIDDCCSNKNHHVIIIFLLLKRQYVIFYTMFRPVLTCSVPFCVTDSTSFMSIGLNNSFHGQKNVHKNQVKLRNVNTFYSVFERYWKILQLLNIKL